MPICSVMDLPLCTLSAFDSVERNLAGGGRLATSSQLPEAFMQTRCPAGDSDRMDARFLEALLQDQDE